jgi:hypothetical protein
VAQENVGLQRDFADKHFLPLRLQRPNGSALSGLSKLFTLLLIARTFLLFLFPFVVVFSLILSYAFFIFTDICLLTALEKSHIIIIGRKDMLE